MGQIAVASFRLDAYVEAALAVMGTALGLPAAGARQRAVIVRRHAARPGLTTRGAFTATGQLVGFCYGFPSQEESWWEQQIRPRLTAAGTGDWLARPAFELTELHVLPERQRCGLGRRLITEVLSSTELPRALLSVRANAVPARSLYRGLGFADLTPPFRFATDQPEYTVMGAELPVPRRLA
ncbi:MAG TPA: GNAT family N-acetyltransferase [Pilimelia sp.]|nr:GNAT family N-acetyltransferase [Pilimelia sp.]